MTRPLEVLPQSFRVALEQTNATLRIPQSSSQDKLKNFGQGNLRELLKKLRAAEKSLGNQIGNLNRTLRVFHRKTPTQLAQVAEFSVDVTAINTGMYPESLTTLGDAYLDYGHSTFVRCGSCKHFASKGKMVKCSILGKLDSDQGAAYDSPCLVRQMSIKELAALSRRFLKRIQTLKDHCNIVRKQIRRILRLVDKNIRLPLLPNSPFNEREQFHFGDRVRVFVFSPCCRKSDRDRWQPGTILHDRADFVICFDHPIMTGRTPRDTCHNSRIVWPKHIWFHREAQFILLHEWEYLKLREMYQTNPEDPFIVTWKSFFSAEFRPYDNLSGTYLRFPMERIVKELFEGKYIPPLGPEQRLMSAKEAAEILEIILHDDISPADVIQNYHSLLHSSGSNLRQLDRAKNTLLLRLYGTNAFD